MIIVAHVLCNPAPGPALGAVISSISIADNIVAVVIMATTAHHCHPYCDHFHRADLFLKDVVAIVKAIVIIDMLVKFAIVLLTFILMSQFRTNAQ